MLTGEGGAGKSRLAAELCVRMRGDDGWDAFFADRDLAADDAWAEFDPDWPLLVVFDYPEQMTLALTTLIDRLNARRRVGPKVRLLLATRQTGGWWQDVNSETNGLLDAATDLRVILTSAGFSPKERAAHASVAVTAFADHLEPYWDRERPRFRPPRPVGR